jgi:hypothetical protein
MRAMLIGFPKAGTSTFARACTLSGLRAAHWRTPRGFCGKLIYESFLAGEDPLAQLAADYDVIAQADVCRGRGENFWPNLDFSVLCAIRRHHPECLLVLNRRDAAKIVSSIARWSNLRKRITDADIPGLPRGYGGEDRHLLAWIEGHYAACAAVFGSDPRYLDLDIEAADARARLSAAMGIDITWWGVANANAEYPAG